MDIFSDVDLPPVKSHYGFLIASVWSNSLEVLRFGFLLLGRDVSHGGFAHHLVGTIGGLSSSLHLSDLVYVHRAFHWICRVGSRYLQA